MKRNPDICPYCGHVILDDDQEYCDYCGMDIEKEEISSKESSGSCLGSLGIVILIILLIVCFLAKN